MSEHISKGGSFTRSRPTHYYTISCLYRPYVRSVMAKLKLRLDGFLAAPHTREKKWKKEKTRPITLSRQFQSFAHTSSSSPQKRRFFELVFVSSLLKDWKYRLDGWAWVVKFHTKQSKRFKKKKARKKKSLGKGLWPSGLDWDVRVANVVVFSCVDIRYCRCCIVKLALRFGKGRKKQQQQ